MLWGEDIPTVVAVDDEGRSTEVTVIAGSLGSAVPLAPPPSSWASRPDADVAIWHLRFDAGAAWELPPARPGTARVLYVFEGDRLVVGDEAVSASTAAVVDASQPVPVRAGAEGPVEVLVLQGRPIGEPVAQQGPFVMNTEAELRQAFNDYRRTGFGGWPWPADDPHHGPDADRFARHADGRVEEPHPVSA
jgi:redox-sensitive bicupin YhaK (pirin superfamily)